MAKATVGPDLLEPLEVLTELVVQEVGHHLNTIVNLAHLIANGQQARLRKFHVTRLCSDEYKALKWNMNLCTGMSSCVSGWSCRP